MSKLRKTASAHAAAMPLPRLQKRALHGQIVDEIGRRIVSGVLQPGKPLTSESGLCAEMGVSRTVLREAFRVLGDKGLIEARPKAGTLVTHPERWNFLDRDVIAWKLGSGVTADFIADLYELRHLIEPVAAALAACRATPDDLRRLKSAYVDMEAAGDDGRALLEPDLRFHRSIIDATGNPLVASLGHLIEAALEANFQLSVGTPRGQRQSMPRHKAVLDAIANGDANAARIAMRQLIEDSKQDLPRAKLKAPSIAQSAKKRRIQKG